MLSTDTLRTAVSVAELTTSCKRRHSALWRILAAMVLVVLAQGCSEYKPAGPPDSKSAGADVGQQTESSGEAPPAAPETGQPGQ